MSVPLKAPYPWFGGKRRVAAEVWRVLGDVDNYVEPFAGSLAVLLLRPSPPRIETVNDLDCYVANFWRATRSDPEAVAAHADSPVNEVDLHARHRWLVLSDDAKAFRERMRTDPDYYDPKVAGRWCWGLCCWIGSGWCQSPESAATKKLPRMTNDAALRAGPRSKVRIAAHNKGSQGKGVHAKGQLPKLHGYASGCVPESSGTHRRPQLADAYDVGRGVNGHGDLGTCEQRRAWLVDWFCRLRDRLRLVRVCCGDWLRVCDSESVTTRLGTTGVFFDPPYGDGADRHEGLYAVDSLTVAADVRRYCLERGGDPRMRIVLAGYAGEGHEELEQHGWACVAWRAQGGYGNRSDKGKGNAERERLWLSPHCHAERGLFDALGDRP